ncbi:MAG: tRNA epoxyqueuosine(34) reductase QueG [Spirochaetaceae bacterium]|nr:MAG: tRNA epoxyqueuosine(34) reductase QueG [Spirochaetaceae bacterium]
MIDLDSPVREALMQEGLELAGIASAGESVPEEERGRVHQWLREGRHGTMHWLERYETLRYNPAELLPGCQSIVFVALNYYQKYHQKPETAADDPSHGQYGRIARYAWGRDYHKELGKRIKRVARRLEERFPGERFRAWTDATPLAERYYGERAGIGFTGRNTLLISGRCGSWFVAGEILTSLALNPSEPAGGRHGNCPSSCKRCLDVCPTGALLEPYRLDAKRCIAYLTIEHEGIIPERLRPLMGNWIFGCDLCQEVCPLNVRARVTDVAGFLRPIAGDRRLLKEVLSIRNDQEFRSVFAGSPLMRARRSRLVRNACIAAANRGARELLPELRRCADDDDEVVAIHGHWALEKLEAADG